MLGKMKGLFHKEPVFSDEQLERNQRRVASIDRARAAVATRHQEEQEIAEIEGHPPPYKTICPPGTTPQRNSTERRQSAGRSNSVATLVGRDGKPAANDNWTNKERRSYGWRAQWHSNADQLYKENGHYYKRQEGEVVGPRRLVPQDHPVYNMSAQEQAELLKKGIDPVTAAEFRRLSSPE